MQIWAEMKGNYYSPYTGETYRFAEDVDIEHIVARSEAHDSGLCAADTFTRLTFASAPLSLAFAPLALNRMVAVKRRFGLAMLEACPSVAMEVVAVEGAELTPAATSVETLTPTPEAEPVEEDPLALYDDNGNGRITCAEARRHGIAPVHSDHPAYAYMRDGDGDGVVCE